MTSPPAANPDPELLFLHARRRREFGDAFKQALGQLSARDRVLLRMHFIDGARIGDLAALHGVHRATLARWLADAQRQVFDATRDALKTQLALTDSECQSLLDAARSHLPVTLHTLLPAE